MTATPPSEVESAPPLHKHTEETRSWIVWNDQGELRSDLSRGEAQDFVTNNRDEDDSIYAECSECAETIES